jgi:hypothetical protein
MPLDVRKANWRFDALWAFPAHNNMVMCELENNLRASAVVTAWTAILPMQRFSPRAQQIFTDWLPNLFLSAWLRLSIKVEYFLSWKSSFVWCMSVRRRELAIPNRGIPQPVKSTSQSTSGGRDSIPFKKKMETGKVTRLPRSESVDSNGRKSIHRFLLYLSSGCAHPKTTYSKPLMNVINQNKHSEGEGIDVKAEVI